MILALVFLSITIVSNDATIWSITYDRHYDDHNSFIIQARGRYSLVSLFNLVSSLQARSETALEEHLTVARSGL
jgi:hypothetical protein